ncbi:hypothetical protein [Nocardia sp. MW-W600-9]
MKDVNMEGSPTAGVMSIEAAHQAIKSFDLELRAQNVTAPFINEMGQTADRLARYLRGNSLLPPADNLHEDENENSYDPAATFGGGGPAFTPSRELVSRMATSYAANHKRIMDHIESEHAIGIDDEQLVAVIHWTKSVRIRFTEQTGKDFFSETVLEPPIPRLDVRSISANAVITVVEAVRNAEEQLTTVTDEIGMLERGLAPKTIGCPLCGLADLLDILSEPLLAVQPPVYFREPRYCPPDRHGRVRDGYLGRLIAEDVAALIHKLASMASTIGQSEDIEVDARSIRSEIRDALSLLSPPTISRNYEQSIASFKSSTLSVIRNVGLAKAFLSISVHYLKDVQSRMSDYTEASGQVPNYSIQISGGVFNGSQVALQISNIESSISSVVNQGNSQLADALEAVKQAALTDPAIPDADRQDLIDNIEYLAESASSEPGARNRGIVRSVLSSLNSAAAAAPQLAQALESWGTILNTIIP